MENRPGLDGFDWTSEAKPCMHAYMAGSVAAGFVRVEAS
jgi:hypothetical protein